MNSRRWCLIGSPKVCASKMSLRFRQSRPIPASPSHPPASHRDFFPRNQHINRPAQGQKISVNADLSLSVPDNPIIPFIEGDGTGRDITPVMLAVVDAAVAKA